MTATAEPTESNPSDANLSPDVVICKNTESSNFDVSALLQTIPRAHKKKAEGLLQELNERSNELTWNSSGVIFINGIAIPDSNIFVLLNLVLQKEKKSFHEISGFKDFQQKIIDMGLSKFIYGSHPQKKVNSNQSGSGQDNVQWWYIGD